MIEKRSFGIACMRYTHGVPEILMIRKRITYAFSDFVRGLYSAREDLINLFNNMTADEKLCILSFRFSHVYYHYNLSLVSGDQYRKYKNMFDATLEKYGNSLRKIILTSHNIQLMWEIPKGQPQNRESDIFAAMREFHEEALIAKQHYIIFPAKVKQSHVDMGVRYVYTYYFARLYENAPAMSHSPFYEVGEIRWMPMSALKFGNLTSTVVVAKKLFKYCKNRLNT